MGSVKYFTLGFVLFITYLFCFWSLSYPINSIDSNLFIRTFGFFILPFTISLMVPYMSTIKINPDKNLLLKGVFWFISTTSILTYSIYLTHSFVYDLKINLPVSIAITYLISWLIYAFFEKPILNYRNKITGYKNI